MVSHVPVLICSYLNEVEGPALVRGHQFDGVLVERAGIRAGLRESSRAGAQRLTPVQPDVEGAANLLRRALRQGSFALPLSVYLKRKVSETMDYRNST